MSIILLLHLLVIIMVPFAMVSEGAYDCRRESSCGSHSPSIRFPFRLHHQPEYCGYPGFKLSCDSKNNTILTLQNSVTLVVREIDYLSQQIRLYDPESCLILKLLHLNLSASPFYFDVEPSYYYQGYNISVFKCAVPTFYSSAQTCASDKEIFAIDSSLGSLDGPPTNATCKKIHKILSSVPLNISNNELPLRWLNPECSYCEGLEMDCGFKNYTNQLSTRCFERPYTKKGAYDCNKFRCGSLEGPNIHFPFRYHHQLGYCGYPSFELSCNCRVFRCKSGEGLSVSGLLTDQYCGNQGFGLSCDTVLTLSDSVRLIVDKIDYLSQKIFLYDPEDCLILKLLHLNLSATPFYFDTDESYYRRPYNFSVFKCSLPSIYDSQQACATDMEIVALDSSSDSLIYLPPSTCKKIHEISSVPYDILNSYLPLRWLNPECRYCEGLEMDCGFKNYTNQLSTRCFERPHTTKAGTLKEPLIAGGVLGLILMGIIMMALYQLYSSSKIERENQVRVETFLEDYRALRPTRYSYADIKKITNLFQEILGEGAYGIVYKGTLSNDIHVAVKVLNDSKGNGEEFINEVAAMGKIHHVNVVRLVGFCADGFRRALVYEYLPNKTLDKLIFPASSKDHITVNWKKLHDIAMGIAKGLEYLHQGCDQQILHFDIKPQNILLDHNLKPKISDFGLAKLCSKEKSAVTMTEARGTMGYIAPEVLSSNFGKASHKSDVYSFGMLLIETVGGRKNFDAKATTSQMNFPEWIHQQLNQGEELKIRIEEDDDIIIVRKLATIGLLCIQWNATDRPSIKVVIQMLEGDGSNLIIPPTFTARNATYAGARVISCSSIEELAAITEQE